MTQTISKIVTFEEFLDERSENKLQELHEGIIIEMQPTGKHEEIGIQEYWIIDYLGMGGRRYIGDPKQPTISIYQLVDEEYQVARFRANDKICSRVFPNLDLTAFSIFQAL